MKKKAVKKTGKPKASAKKPVVKKSAKKSGKVSKKTKLLAKKSTLVKKKVEKKKVIKHKIEPKKVMKKPEPKKKTNVKAKEVKKASAPKKITKPVATPKATVKPKPAPISEKVQAKPAATAAQNTVPASNGNEKKRFSEKELAEFRALIVEKLDQAKKDYDLLKNTLCHTDDHGTDDTSPTFKALEDGSDVLTREETAQLALRQEKFIQNLQNALVRIENKTYGICRVTGKLIPKERLMRVPHATLSIDAKLVQQFNQ